MKAPTHTSFSLCFYLSAGLLIGATSTPPALATAVIGGLLPDIDTPQSAIGRMLPPLSSWMERKLGHRGATHSLLALVVLGLITLPVITITPLGWTALLIGYFSHLFLDTLNKTGVPLFYPSPTRAIMRWCVAVGSTAEVVLFILFSLLLLLLLPINQLGLFHALHALLKDTRSAISDYRAWENQYRVYTHIKGILNTSQQPIEAQFEIVGVESSNRFVAYDSSKEVLYTIGTDKNANIYPKSIRCQKGEPIQVITRKVHLQNELLGNLTQAIPQTGDSFIKGAIKTTDTVIAPQDPDTHAPIQPGINEITLHYARAGDVEDVNISSVFVISGDCYIRTILPLSSPVPAPQAQENTASNQRNLYTAELYIHNVHSDSEILVHEGQEIQAGEVIAELSSENNTQLLQEEQRLHQHMATLTTQTDAVLQLLLTHARLRLQAIKAEREKHRISAPFNARVLLVRTHSINNNNRTIAIKLLVTDEKVSSP